MGLRSQPLDVRTLMTLTSAKPNRSMPDTLLRSRALAMAFAKPSFSSLCSASAEPCGGN